MGDEPEKPVLESKIPDRAELAAYLKQYDYLSLYELLRADIRRYKGFLNAIHFEGFWAVFFYRVAHRFHISNADFLGKIVQLMGQFLFKCEIGRKAVIGPGMAIYHSIGIVIAPRVMIGRTFTINSGAFIASNLDPDDPEDYPLLADGVTISTGAKVLGPIVLGKGATLGPNTVVMKSIPSHSTVLPASSMVISKDKWKAQKASAAQPAADPAPKPQPPAPPPATDASKAKPEV